MCKDHRCYGYIIITPFTAKSEMVWYFIGVHVINRTLYVCLEIRNFSSRVEKYFTNERSELVKYFSTHEEKFRISIHLTK